MLASIRFNIPNTRNIKASIDVMASQVALIQTAEAAFIAGLTDRQMNRVVDETLVPQSLFERHGNIRRFTRLSAAFANFYFDTDDLLIAEARRQILEELTQRVEKLLAKDEVFALLSVPKDLSWKVSKLAVEIDLAPYISRALLRARDVDHADALVSSCPEIMNGAPVFSGTRVPIDIVLSSLEDNTDMGRLRASYPFLTDAHVDAARTYQQVHPKRGRPRLAEVNQLSPRKVTRLSRSART
ncbi:DUF433 domain-containing protein [Tahibacter amnicola]|uniref:DUF433 domain-containing protein n=1 Tax=Tahibacter amnicola TaxID=2976241 RepID=A0ABY6BFR3_9GAMM|nr:DUF433 domain-containing protein [Tahibacter amnicola]UXI68873.1 DUF433 domain-containing protein [Tahibacter amnicola]